MFLLASNKAKTCKSKISKVIFNDVSVTASDAIRMVIGKLIYRFGKQKD